MFEDDTITLDKNDTHHAIQHLQIRLGSNLQILEPTFILTPLALQEGQGRRRTYMKVVILRAA